MKINWSFFTRQKGIVIVSLIMCLVILTSANYIYAKSRNDVPDISDAGQNNNESEDPVSKNEDENIEDVAKENQSNNSTQADYFDAYRTNRQSIRDMEMRYVQTVTDNESTDASVKKEAEERLLEIAALMESELKLESLIKAKGFDDVIAFVEEGSVNIVVKAEKLTSAQATKILKIVVDETGEASQNVTIITRT